MCHIQFQWNLACLQLQACRCDSHLLFKLVGVNGRILRVNLTFVYWCRVSNVLFWPIFPDMIVDFARIQGYEERKEGAYARDEVNIRANAPRPVLSRSSVQKEGRRGVFFGSLRYIIICTLVKCISLTTPIHWCVIYNNNYIWVGRLCRNGEDAQYMQVKAV